MNRPEFQLARNECRSRSVFSLYQLSLSPRFVRICFKSRGEMYQGLNNGMVKYRKRVQSVTKLLSTARHNSGKVGWGRGSTNFLHLTLKLRLGSDKVSPFIAWIFCDKAFLSPHTFSTDEELLTHQNCA